MKKEKNVNYYRSLLHKDSITLLVIAIIFTIINILFMGNGYDEAVPIFLKSIVFIIISIIIICNKREMKKFIGILSIITSCLMMLTSIGDGSLFGIVYFLLGIFLGIHSFLYLKKFGNYNIYTNYSNEVVVKNKKMKYISLIPMLITIILVIFGFMFNKSLIGVSWCSISILVVNIISIILCIILHRKKIKSVLVYIILVISIMITLFIGLFLIDEIRQNIRKNKYRNSEQYIVDLTHYVEESISYNSTEIQNQKLFDIHQGDNIILLDDYLKKTNYKNSNLTELKNKGYKCVGYLQLTFDEDADYNAYLKKINDEYYLQSSYAMNRYFKKVKTYLKCDGKYSYQTIGFNENIINNKEEIFSIIVPE